MGKNKRRQFKLTDTRTGNDVCVDSKEEVLVFKWLLKALDIGVISDFSYQPDSFVLSDSFKCVINGKKKTLFREHIYTPDFRIRINKKYKETFGKYFILLDSQTIDDDPDVLIDVKGVFQRFGGDRSFSINQKWVHQKYGKYVQKVVPKDMFLKMGILKEFLVTDTGKPSKVFQGYPTIDDIFK